MMKRQPTTNKLSPAEIKELQRVIGRFPFYGRVTDPTMLHALNSLATSQFKGTEQTMKEMLHFLQMPQSDLQQAI